MLGHSLSDHMAALEEVERLRALNAELVEALQYYADHHPVIGNKASTALAKAKGQS